MYRYMNSKLLDMHFIYSSANYSGTAVIQLCRSQILTPLILTHTILLRLYYQFREMGRFNIQMIHTSVHRTTWARTLEETLLSQFENDS